MASSSFSMAHQFVLPLILPLFLCLSTIASTNAIIDGVDDVQLQQQQQMRQPFALFAVAQESDENGIGSPSLMAKRHLLDALIRQGRSPRAASSATMRNALVRFGKRALLFPPVALDDKRNPPQPFVRFGRSAADVPDQQQQLYFPAL